jgi:hypothetical protein
MFEWRVETWSYKIIRIERQAEWRQGLGCISAGSTYCTVAFIHYQLEWDKWAKITFHFE